MAVEIAIAGASGRMGQMVVAAALQASDVQLVGAWDRADAPLLGKDAALWLGQESGCIVSADLQQALGQARCAIDFTRPEATMQLLEVALYKRCALVIGTTGFSAKERAAIEEAAKALPIVLAPNMALGVNVLLYLVEQAARLLPAYDAEIFELHHRFKVDAPSGTALEIGRSVARARGVEMSDAAIWARHGHTGARPDGAIGFAALRAGDVVGDHTLFLAANGERLEITHRAQSRMPYALGALAAARFVVDKPPGLYTMRQVLGLP